MLATLILAAATVTGPALAVWPAVTGPARSTVAEVEFFVTEPEDEYWILAVQPLPKPLQKADDAELQRLARLASRLGADAVILLAELAEGAIPEDVRQPLPASGAMSAAAFITFDCGCEEGDSGARHAALPRSPRPGQRTPRRPAH